MVPTGHRGREEEEEEEEVEEGKGGGGGEGMRGGGALTTVPKSRVQYLTANCKG